LASDAAGASPAAVASDDAVEGDPGSPSTVEDMGDHTLGLLTFSWRSQTGDIVEVDVVGLVAWRATADEDTCGDGVAGRVEPGARSEGSRGVIRNKSGIAAF
jgi:hypothetical protein